MFSKFWEFQHWALSVIFEMGNIPSKFTAEYEWQIKSALKYPKITSCYDKVLSLGSECSRNLSKQQNQKKKRLWNSATILVWYMGVANVRLANFPIPKNSHIFWPKNSTNFANLACSNISNILVSPVPNEMVLLLLGLLIASL